MHYKWTLHSRTSKQVKHLWFAKFKNEKIAKFEFSIYAVISKCYIMFQYNTLCDLQLQMMSWSSVLHAERHRLRLVKKLKKLILDEFRTDLQLARWRVNSREHQHKIPAFTTTLWHAELTSVSALWLIINKRITGTCH